MSGDLFVKIVSAIITIIVAIIGAYVVPYIKAKIGAVEYEKLYKFALTCVQWANQTIPPEEWERKKQEVMDAVIDYMNKYLKISLTYEQIEKIVEALVNACKDASKSESVSL